MQRRFQTFDAEYFWNILGHDFLMQCVLVITDRICFEYKSAAIQVMGTAWGQALAAPMCPASAVRQLLCVNTGVKSQPLVGL